MKKFTSILESSPQIVYLDDNKGGSGFYTYKSEISNLNSDIIVYITEVYKDFGFKYQSGNKDINVNNKVINTEYIDKMVNNYTVFKTFIRENGIKDKDTFYSLMRYKLYDVYHYNASFFNRQTLPVLINTTRKGNVGEIKCKKKFTEYANSKELNILIDDPTLEEDIRGIDGKFSHEGKEFTMQIKPFTKYETINDVLYASSDGSLSIGSIDYLILYSDTEYIIIKNPSKNPITIDGKFFVSPVSNVLDINKFF